MELAVLGAGNGGLAAAAQLTQRGHSVRLWNRSAAPIDALVERGGIELRGALGDVRVEIAQATTDLADALAGVDAIVVVLPATAHGPVATALAEGPTVDVPVLLNPGHMCGSLHVRRVFEAAGRPAPPVAELGTLAHVCRSPEPGVVDVYLETQQVPVATVPHDDETLKLALDLFPGTRAAISPLETWFHDVNLVLHPPGMILGASRIEDETPFKFYDEGITPAVATVMERLDDERRAVASAFGLDLPDLATTMAGFGTVEDTSAGLREAVRSGEANRLIDAPSSLDHRYLHEDVGFGLVPFMALAGCAGVATPVARSLTAIAETITGRAYGKDGLNARRLGIEGLDAGAVAALAVGES
jgi:opine dehydrogenase